MIALKLSADACQYGFPDRSQIESVQLFKLRALLQAIVPANSFYTNKLGAESAQIPFFSLDECMRSLPFTTKHEIIQDQKLHPPYGSNLSFPLASYIRYHQTSGSTMTPIPWLDTQESWNHIVGNWVEILKAAGVTEKDRFFFAFSFGPFIGFWSALEAALRLGCFCFPGGAMSSQARLNAILQHGITVLCCTPSYARHLGEIAREEKIDLSQSHMRLLVVAGEAGGSIPATRASIESLWGGAMVFDHHGMTEVGPVSYQCPAQPGVLHILESAYLPEVIDPLTRKTVAPGETGELVLTTLDRVGSPLIRYCTGDLVKPRPRGECACGRHDLACEGGILGRSDDMVIVRGVNIFPSMIEEIVRSNSAVTEYRVTLDCRTPMTELSIEIEIDAGASDHAKIQRRIEHALECSLNLRVPVRMCQPGTLPRFEMKAQRWVRLTSEARAA